jgi:hypothetical protein
MRGLDFFENMLPEGPALERMAALSGVSGVSGVRPVDTYGVLATFGRDCAGAIMMLPDGDRPGGNADSGYSPMTPGDLKRVIGALDVAPLGAAPERGFRPSLAGFQRKALLGRAGDGTSRPGTPHLPGSSKPDGPHTMAANEATCLRLAAACGLPAPEVELLDVTGLPVLADCASAIRIRSASHRRGCWSCPFLGRRPSRAGGSPPRRQAGLPASQDSMLHSHGGAPGITAACTRAGCAADAARHRSGRYRSCAAAPASCCNAEASSWRTRSRPTPSSAARLS